MEDWLAQAIVQGSPDSIVFADREGTIAATLRDVTERWRRDKELRERLARLEKRTTS